MRVLTVILAWMVAAFLPLPVDPATVDIPSPADLEQAYIPQLGPDADKAYQKARWWRNLNRVMSGIGTLLIGVIVSSVTCLQVVCVLTCCRSHWLYLSPGWSNLLGHHFPTARQPIAESLSSFVRHLVAIFQNVHFHALHRTALQHVIPASMECSSNESFTTIIMPCTPFFVQIFWQRFVYPDISASAPCEFSICTCTLPV